MAKLECSSQESLLNMWSYVWIIAFVWRGINSSRKPLVIENMLQYVAKVDQRGYSEPSKMVLWWLEGIKWLLKCWFYLNEQNSILLSFNVRSTQEHRWTLTHHHLSIKVRSVCHFQRFRINASNVQCKNVINFLAIGEHVWPGVTKIKLWKQ